MLQVIWQEPETLIRYSDTLEDTFANVTAYTMDEEDENWLAAGNRAVQHARDHPVLPRSARTAKGKPKAPPPPPLPLRELASEDNFEKVMDMFEGVTGTVKVSRPPADVPS